MNPESAKAFFESFGYIFLKNAFSSSEIKEISIAADEIWEKERNGAQSKKDGQHIVPFVEQSPLLTKLIDDDRIYNYATTILAEDMVWGGSEGNITTRGEHLWHPDRPGDHQEINYDRLKVNIYLDPVTADRGCLRVIPASHREPLHGSIEPENRHQNSTTVNPFNIAGENMPSIPVESNPGDVIFFHQSLWHAVFNGWPNRRFIALKYAAKPINDRQIASLVYYSADKLLNTPKSLLESNRPRIKNLVRNLHDYAIKDVPDFIPFRPN